MLLSLSPFLQHIITHTHTHIKQGGCDETGGVRSVVLFSLIVSTLMIAFKLSQVSGLGEAQRILDVQHRSCVRLLADLGDAEENMKKNKK